MPTKIKTIRIGTRGSKLALWQAHHIAAEIKKHQPEVSLTLVPIQTTGDKIDDVPLAKIGGKGLFLKEIETALLENKIDLAVHSMKDVPAELPAGLVITVIPPREDPRDILASHQRLSFEELPKGAVVGTSSLRRLCQLKSLRSDLTYKDLRGNVDTRLRKMHDGEYDAVILAAAGLKRLNLSAEIVQNLSIIPAVAQGAIGVEVRSSDKDLIRLLAPLDHPQSHEAVRIERAFLKLMEGSCQVPLGCHAHLENGSWSIQAFLANPDGQIMIKRQAIASSAQQAIGVAESLAKDILQSGGAQILKELQLS